MLNQSSPVGKTAFDSLQSKQSAVLAGYDPIVVRNIGNYKDLLRQVTSDWKIKNQTPLVNAGYAARVLVISHIIQSFVSYHVLRKADRIQIALLGCGGDIIGLWAHSLCPDKVVLLEIDTQEVCSLKKDILIQKELVIPHGEDDDSGGSGKLIGAIRHGGDSLENSKCNYFLCPTDLRDISALNSTTQQYMDSTTPTLAISELVLSYLRPNETDSLLNWCSTTLCTAPNSCTVALETLGSDTSLKVIAPIEGYKKRYCELFENKMERGQAKNKEKKQSFYPIGSSCEGVVKRFLECGFDTSHASDLGKAAAFAARPKTFQIPEIFDEHAALVCYFKSYSIVHGYSRETDGLLRRMMCPWHFALTEVQPSLYDDGVVISVIEPIDEESVRNLVYNIYEPKFDEFPAVRKMVKTMMNSDLATKLENKNNSEIANYYSSLGGSFFVAIEYSGKERQMVGCVGVRPCERKEKSKTFEVVRLAVNPSHQGRGIGRKLLEMVERFSMSRGATSLIANTISILGSALSLYQSCEYQIEKEVALGPNLNMLTFSKQI